MSARLIDQLTQGFGVPRPRVKRALFGPVDHEENLRFVQRELARNREEARIKWNYDFSRDVPLPGRYQWEEPRLNSSRQSNCDRQTDDKKGEEGDARERGESSQRAKRVPRDRVKHQTHITDYLQHRKRSKSKVKLQERKTRAASSSSSSKGSSLVQSPSPSLSSPSSSSKPEKAQGGGHQQSEEALA
eukprot:TRINITY_DN1517_c0_g1_i1.p1 TRINITY_DN1517_c0_g1~~TRINITY_DN1517_c0_g1_i1.p1  ORF type:complete len:188 (-),score=68.31 TRINITY_DN1517_c0_g1_i1:301-864(-)